MGLSFWGGAESAFTPPLPPHFQLEAVNFVIFGTFVCS